MACCTFSKPASCRSRSEVTSSTCHTTSPPLRREPGIGRHRLHRDAEPARTHIFLGLAKRGQPKLLAERPALLRGAREAEDLLGEIGVAGEGTVWRLNYHVWLETEQAAIGPRWRSTRPL